MSLLFIPQMIQEYEALQWNDTDRKIEELREEPVPVPPCSPQNMLSAMKINDYILK
jgi:hypothetical protein